MKHLVFKVLAQIACRNVRESNGECGVKKIVRRAGIEGWPKPFQNLRSSRQTELEQDYPTYVVCEWLGNTSNIAHKHYLTVTEEHFQDAAENGGLAGDKRGMQPPVTPRTDSHKETLVPHEVRKNATFAEVVDVLNSCELIDALLLLTFPTAGQFMTGVSIEVDGGFTAAWT